MPAIKIQANGTANSLPTKYRDKVVRQNEKIDSDKGVFRRFTKMELLARIHFDFF